MSTLPKIKIIRASRMEKTDTSNDQKRWTATNNILEQDRTYIARPSRRIPIVLKTAREAELTDLDGRKYLDFTSGWNVANVGWNSESVLSAVGAQLNALPFAPNWCTNNVKVDFVKILANLVPGNWAVVPATGGSEAVEHTLKLARLATGREAILSCEGSYHGGTLGALRLSGSQHVKNALPSSSANCFIPLPSVASDNWVNAAVLRINETPAPAAFIFEPIFTNQGVLTGTKRQYLRIEAAAKARGVLIICDEVGTGFGRSGKMFGFQQYGIQPDMISLAKAMTGGVVPCGAALVKKELAQLVLGNSFSSTFGITPLAAAAGIATINQIQQLDLCRLSEELGQFALTYLRSNLRTYVSVLDIRGYGLLLAIDFTPQVDARKFTDECMKAGLFLEISKNPGTT